MQARNGAGYIGSLISSTQWVAPDRFRCMVVGCEDPTPLSLFPELLFQRRQVTASRRGTSSPYHCPLLYIPIRASIAEPGRAKRWPINEGHLGEKPPRAGVGPSVAPWWRLPAAGQSGQRRRRSNLRHWAHGSAQCLLRAAALRPAKTQIAPTPSFTLRQHAAV